MQQADAYLPALLVWVKAVLIQRLAWQIANQDLLMINCAHARCVAQEVIEPAFQNMGLRCRSVHKIHACIYSGCWVRRCRSVGTKMQHACLYSKLDRINHCMQVKHTCHGLHSLASGRCKPPNSTHNRTQISPPEPACIHLLSGTSMVIFAHSCIAYICHAGSVKHIYVMDL